MTEFSIKLAEIPIRVRSLFPSTKDFCRDYLTEEAPELEVVMEKEDIDETRILAARQDALEGRHIASYSDEYLETLALYRKILDEMVFRRVLLIHGSAVACQGKCYVFTAKSGTGKTTHTELWVKHIPDCHVLNGDKPLLLFREDGVYVCGTPWQGKENYGTNEILPLAGICLLERGEKNFIEKIPFRDALKTLLVQIHRPLGHNRLLESVRLTRCLTEIPAYRLSCNMEAEAAAVSYRGMVLSEQGI